jgi:hypothetical protein
MDLLMDLLTPVTAVLSVFVAYYFGQKSRTTPLRSAAYSKQVDVVDDLSKQFHEWSREMHEAYSKIDSASQARSREEKEKIREYQVRAAGVASEAATTSLHRGIFLPSSIINKLDDVIQALLARKLKISDLAVKKVGVDRDPEAEVASEIEKIRNTAIKELRKQYRESCSSFRDTCREELGIEALSEETKQAMRHLEETTLPQLSQD